MYYSLMDCMDTMCKVWGCSPFEILSCDVEDFINALNYLILKSDRDEERKLAKMGYSPTAKGDPLRMFL